MSVNTKQKQTLTQFSELDLPAPLKKSLETMGFSTMTPIQQQAIPMVMEGHDLIGLAQTGTGKTAAFAVPMILKLLQNPHANGLVLVPTRELAAQVRDVFRELTQNNPELGVISLIGGESLQPQNRKLQKHPRIFVATPGRLVDHLGSKPEIIAKCSVFVMDEADRMLDMGFAPQLKHIYPRLPKERQTLLFSATFPREIEDLSKKFTRNPLKVQVGQVNVPVSKIHQRAVKINGELKNDRLLDEINAREGSILVFVRTKRRTDKVTKFLKSYGLEVTAIHGNKTQAQRNLAIKNFTNESARILCATDIVARGLDISHVAHVINYDLPMVAEDYVHRIGRTARNGRAGESLSFIGPDEVILWKNIENLLKTKGAVPTIENAMVKNPKDHVRPDPIEEMAKASKKKASAAKVVIEASDDDSEEAFEESSDENFSQNLMENQDAWDSESEESVIEVQAPKKAPQKIQFKKADRDAGRPAGGRVYSERRFSRTNDRGGRPGDRAGKWNGERRWSSQESSDRGGGGFTGERRDSRDFGKKKSWSSDRPSFSDRPSRGSEDRGFGRGQDSRSEGRGSFERKPRFQSDNQERGPGRPSFRDRPARADRPSFSSDRPSRGPRFEGARKPEGSSDSHSSWGDRSPRRDFGRSDRVEGGRDFKPRERSFGGDRPRAGFGRSSRPQAQQGRRY